MVDLNPEIWNNPTLGEAGAGPFLDEVEANALEEVYAKQEGREPRVFTHYPRHPSLISSETVPSDINQLAVEESKPMITASVRKGTKKSE